MTVMASLSGWFGSNEALVQNALVLTLLGFSFQVALRAGVFSLAGVGFYAVGGYTAAILVQHGWAAVTAIATALIAAAAVGLVLALILGRLRTLYLAMATVAFDLLVQILAENLNVTGGVVGLFGIPVKVTTLSVALLVAVSALVLWRLERGVIGRTTEALRVDEHLAATLGVDIVRQRVVAFVLSAVLGALAGALNALMFNTLAPSQVGFELIVAGLTVIVIGGTSSWLGPVIGAFIVTWLPDWLAFAGEWRIPVQGAIVIIMVLYASDGIVGLLQRARRWSVVQVRPRRRRTRLVPEAVE
jgi:branched-chain amino acid transport system permease protein